MSDLTKLLSNLRSLRAAAKEMSLEELEEALSKFSGIVAERRDEEEAMQREQEEKKRKIRDFVEQMKTDGIDFDELLSEIQDEPVKGKRRPRPPKYEWYEEGERKTWTGQGRKPSFLQDAIDAGQSLDDFLIVKE